MPTIDADRPITDQQTDEYGFAEMAKKLAPSIAELANGESVVFGIEGPWGSGKTSFLNFLRSSLETDQKPHVVTLAPWLIGDSRDLVSALIASMAPILADLEAKDPARKWYARKAKVAKAADLLKGYAVMTGRGLGPLAKMAGLAVPGLSIVGEAIELGTSTIGGLKGPSETQVKESIANRIRELNARFIVLIDDLDRLEPHQAVEVVRLVRSVADFPNVAYVLCYDRAILGHALETGLSVKDGDLFLQKIVQLTFTLPMPEPFDLRLSLRKKLIALFKHVAGRDLTGDESDDLMRSVDREGTRLRTPRDVKLVLNAVSFIYPSIANEVYFPDLCRIRLIKIVHPRLHQWIEEYLGSRSVLVSGDARINKSERARLGDRLLELMPDDDMESPNSIWSLLSFVPGLVKTDNSVERVFNSVSDRDIEQLVNARRLGSPFHSRFYFALSAPKAMIPEADMRSLREAAGQDVTATTRILDGFIEIERHYGQSWIEHLLMRLDDVELRTYSIDQLAGLATALAVSAGHAIRKHERIEALAVSLSTKIQWAVDLILTKIKRIDAAHVTTVTSDIFRRGDLAWLVGRYYRQQLYDHGRLGDRANPADQRVHTDAVMDQGRATLEARLSAATDDFLDFKDFGAFIFGWRDMSGVETPKAWVTQRIAADADFLKFLLQMRSWAASDRVYYPLRRDAVEIFVPWRDVITRLQEIERHADEETSRTLSSIKLSIKQGRDHAGDDFDAGEDSTQGEDHPDEAAANPAPADGEAS
ncbi:hypothetical protein D4A92_17680 [Rhizobium rosettiformans]|uniref:KAP NTPase domain-containing protein n=1 Tax=Rhizobium rosettiformans TaxID=1368430 RepID=A0ABX7EYG7_9HYPH|nr:P-loop NTPase fold protein [Rhizobium rosettiformans]QRF53137.1 hypothetical protein D4A92_17680 [Rhizobium rosettiformans]